MGTTLCPPKGGHFVVPVGMGPGSPEPLGPSLVEVTAGSGPDATCTLNFAVRGGARAERTAGDGAAGPAGPALRTCLRGAHHCDPRATSPGSLDAFQGPPLPQAPTRARPLPPLPNQTQVFSRHAAAMSLCILRRDGGGYLEVGLDPLTHRTGDVWHVQLTGLKSVGGLVYGWRAAGQTTWAGEGAAARRVRGEEGGWGAGVTARSGPAARPCRGPIWWSRWLASPVHSNAPARTHRRAALTHSPHLHYTPPLALRPPPPSPHKDGGCFHAAYIMLDPYCPRALPVELPQAAYDAAPLLPPGGRLPGPVLLGSLCHLTEGFDWGGSPPDGPRRSLEESVLLELDVQEFTTGGLRGGEAGG